MPVNMNEAQERTHAALGTDTGSRSGTHCKRTHFSCVPRRYTYLISFFCFKYLDHHGLHFCPGPIRCLRRIWKSVSVVLPTEVI